MLTPAASPEESIASIEEGFNDSHSQPSDIRMRDILNRTISPRSCHPLQKGDVYRPNHHDDQYAPAFGPRYDGNFGESSPIYVDGVPVKFFRKPAIGISPQPQQDDSSYWGSLSTSPTDDDDTWECPSKFLKNGMNDTQEKRPRKRQRDSPEPRPVKRRRRQSPESQSDTRQHSDRLAMPKKDKARHGLNFLGGEESGSDGDGMPGVITSKDSRVMKEKVKKDKEVKKDTSSTNAHNSGENQSAPPYGPFGASSDLLKDWIQRRAEPWSVRESPPSSNHQGYF